MMVDRPSVRQVLAQLARVETLAPDAEARVREALARDAQRQMPWYLRLVVGAGAWIGALFLLPFIGGLAVLIFGSNEVALILLGLIIAGGATALRRRFDGPFARQAALVCCFAGQALTIGAAGSVLRSAAAAGLVAIAISAALLALYPDRIQRFSSTLVIVGALTVIIGDWKLFGAIDALMLAIVFTLLLLWRIAPRASMEEAADLVHPVVYGLVFGLFGLFILDAAIGSLGVGTSSFAPLRPGLATRVGLVLALLWLESTIFAEHAVALVRPEAVLTFAGTLLLGVLTRPTPAIVAAMLVGLLGFDRRARSLVALACAFFVLFGAFYYYSLQITLLEKSLVLVSSGLICLAAWAVVRWRFRPPAPTIG